MKKFTYILVGIGLFAAGWFIGQRQTLSPSTGGDMSSELLKMQMFNTAYSETAFAEALGIQLDAGRTDDAKSMLRTHQDGHILMLDSLLSSPSFTSNEISELRELNVSIHASGGSMRQMADKILARVAQRRTAPPEEGNSEVEARLAAILKQANESQK